MIKSLVLINLALLLASTAGGAPLSLRVPAVEAMKVTLRSAESGVTPNVGKRPEWSPPQRAFWGCACRGFGFGILRPPPRPHWDPLGQLAEAFQAGEGFEVWALERAVDTRDRIPGFWGSYAYRDIAITTVVRTERGLQPQWIFARLVDGLTRGAEPHAYELFEDEPTLRDALAWSKFKPDYVMTIGEESALRFELDRLQRLLLVQSRDHWSLVELPVSESEYLCAALEACIHSADATATPTHLGFNEADGGRAAVIATQSPDGDP